MLNARHAIRFFPPVLLIMLMALPAVADDPADERDEPSRLVLVGDGDETFSVEIDGTELTIMTEDGDDVSVHMVDMSQVGLIVEDALGNMDDVFEALEEQIEEWLEERGVYVHVLGRPRVTYFVPEQGADARPRGYSPEGPPADAVRVEWSDRFVIVQERTYRYSAPKVLEIRRQVSPPHLTATAEVQLVVTHREAGAAEGPPRPDPPAGYVHLHKGGQRNLRAAWASEVHGEPGKLPVPYVPPGELLTLFKHLFIRAVSVCVQSRACFFSGENGFE